MLNNQAGPARDVVCLNAGAAIYVAGLASSLFDGIEIARQNLANGAAKNLRDEIKEAAHG